MRTAPVYYWLMSNAVNMFAVLVVEDKMFRLARSLSPTATSGWALTQNTIDYGTPEGALAEAAEYTNRRTRVGYKPISKELSSFNVTLINSPLTDDLWTGTVLTAWYAHAETKGI